MARDYWVQVSVKPVDQEDDPGMASGVRITIRGDDSTYRGTIESAAEALQTWILYYQEKEWRRERPWWKKVLFG